MNSVEPGSDNSSKENSSKSKWTKKSIDHNYLAMVTVIATLLLGFWNMDSKFDAMYGKFDTVNSRIDNLYEKFVQLQNQNGNTKELLYEKFAQLQLQNAKDKELLNDKLENYFEISNNKIEGVIEEVSKLKEDFIILSNKVENLEMKVDLLQPENSTSSDKDAIVENETSGIEDLNASKVSLATNQEFINIGT